MNGGAGDGGSQVPSSDGKCWLGSYSGKINVTDFGADKTGVADAAPAINAATSAAQTIGIDVYAPAGTYHVKSAINIGYSPGITKSQCIKGDGWETIIDVSTDFSTSALGVIIPLFNGNTPATVQLCERDLHVRFNNPLDLQIATTAASAATTTTITMANTTGVLVGDYVYDVTHPTAIVPAFPTTAAGATTVSNIVGNVITLSAAIVAPGVSNGDTISFAQPRANFTTLSSGCSLAAGAPGCKYPWAIYMAGGQNSMIDHVLIDGAWDGVYQRGSTYSINNLYVAALDQALNQDSSFNFPQINNFEAWNGFGFQPQFSSSGYAFSENYYDGQAICANFGESDGLAASNFQCWTGKLNLLSSWSWGQFSDLMMDGTFADISMATANNNKWVQIANLYSTSGPSIESVPVISVSQGKMYIGRYNAVVAPKVPIINVSGGQVHIRDGYISAGNTGNSYAATVSSGILDIRNTILDAPSNCAGNLAGWAQTTSSGVLQLVRDTFTTTCTGLNAATFATDGIQNIFSENILAGWGFSGPTSFAAGPQGVYASLPRVIASGSSDTQKLTDTVINWNSASGLAKSESIYGCGANNAGATLLITDGFGDAAAHAITITPQGGTIAFAATAVISANHGTDALTCDGVSNWIVK